MNMSIAYFNISNLTTVSIIFRPRRVMSHVCNVMVVRSGMLGENERFW